MRQREQTGHICEAFGAFHIRYWVAYNDLPADEKEIIRLKCDLKNKALPSRVQKSERLCDDTASRKERDKLIKAVMDRVNDHTPGEPIIPELTLAEFWDKHYLPWAIANLKPSTLHGYKQVFNQHLTKFGKHPLEGHLNPDGYEVPHAACRRRSR
jgi:hypothetical protein